MFPVIMSLALIGLAVAWFFSCSGSDPMCQITKSFSTGAGILGLLCLAIGVFAIVEDRRGNGRPRKPDESHRDDQYCGRCGCPLPHTHRISE